MPERLSPAFETQKEEARIAQLEARAKELNAIIIICMCCKEYIGMKDGEGEYGISHGLCELCEKKVREDLKKK